MSGGFASCNLHSAAWLIILWVAPLAQPAGAVIGLPDAVPGATLLLPFLEVDLAAGCSGVDRNTLLTVENVGAGPALVKLSVWTNWGVPVLNFQIYLAAGGSQLVDLQSVLCLGRLPVTGAGVEPFPFPNCEATIPYPDPAISANFRAHIKAWMTGNQSLATGNCAGEDVNDEIGRGYVTLDSVGGCDLHSPNNPLINLAFANVLTGHFNLVRGGTTSPDLPLVALEAMGPVGAPPHTFYGRYRGGDGSDAREPLPSQYCTSFDATAGAETAILVWRESGPGTSGAACGSTPSRIPVAPAPALFLHPASPTHGAALALPLESNRFVVTDEPMNPFASGTMDLDLRHDGVSSVYGDQLAQAFALTLQETGDSLVPVPTIAGSCFLFSDGFESGDTSAW